MNQPPPFGRHRNNRCPATRYSNCGNTKYSNTATMTTQTSSCWTPRQGKSLSSEPAQSAKQSAVNCGPRHAIELRLKADYGEHLVATGLAANHDLMHLYVAPGTGTWSLAALNASGVLCLLASGEGFELQKVQPEGVQH